MDRAGRNAPGKMTTQSGAIGTTTTTDAVQTTTTSLRAERRLRMSGLPRINMAATSVRRVKKKSVVAKPA